MPSQLRTALSFDWILLLCTLVMGISHGSTLGNRMMYCIVMQITVIWRFSCFEIIQPPCAWDLAIVTISILITFEACLMIVFFEVMQHKASVPDYAPTLEPQLCRAASNRQSMYRTSLSEKFSEGNRYAPCMRLNKKIRQLGCLCCSLGRE